jgi:hypothetical protein
MLMWLPGGGINLFAAVNVAKEGNLFGVVNSGLSLLDG